MVTQASAARSRAVLMEIERSLGFLPTDREFEELCHDVKSSVRGTGKLHFIEVKGRVSGADTITVTKNEALYLLNKPDDFMISTRPLLTFCPAIRTMCIMCASPSDAKLILASRAPKTDPLNYLQLTAPHCERMEEWQQDGILHPKRPLSRLRPSGRVG